MRYVPIGWCLAAIREQSSKIIEDLASLAVNLFIQWCSCHWILLTIDENFKKFFNVDTISSLFKDLEILTILN